MKRIICIIAMLFTMAFIIPISSFADEELYSYGHFYYHDHDGYVSIAGYLGAETEIVIPSTIIGKPVSEIESGAFNGCHTIIQITVPDTVVMVYEDSFTGADSLERIISDSPAVDYEPETKLSADTLSVTTTAATALATSAENIEVTTQKINTIKNVKTQAEQTSETIISTDNNVNSNVSVPYVEECINVGDGEKLFDRFDNPNTKTSAATINSNETSVQPRSKTASTLPFFIIGAVAAIAIIAGVLFLKRKEK